MKKINIIFGNDLEDVDIIIVPDHIAGNIEFVTQEFFDWLKTPENQSRFKKRDSSGKYVMSIGTHEFIWWLNKYKNSSNHAITIFREHTFLCEDFPSVDF